MEELEDDISNVFIWFWSFKDYLKGLIKHHNGDSQCIENLVNNDQKLSVCADIANGLKHGSLTRSRSGKYPVLGELGYTVPQNSMKKLVFRGPEIEFDFKNFESIEIKMSILDSTGSELGQALNYLDYAVNIWEQEFDSIRKLKTLIGVIDASHQLAGRCWLFRFACSLCLPSMFSRWAHANA
jgi:hypothetical protein